MMDEVRKKQSARRREQLDVFLDSSTALSVRTDWLLALPRCQRHGYDKVDDIEANWRVLSQMLLCTKELHQDNALNIVVLFSALFFFFI